MADKLTTEQKVGIGIAATAVVAGIGAIILSAFEEDEKFKPFANFKPADRLRRRLGARSCKPCDE